MPNPKSAYQNRIELLQGTLDMLILRTLQWGSQHGHGIGQAIRPGPENSSRSKPARSIRAPSPRKAQGWLKSEWGVSEANQRAKFYRLTPLGKKQLAADHARWNGMVASIESIMTAASPTGSAS